MPNRCCLRITGGGCVFLALALLLLPLKWLCAALGACVFHELCHLAAIRLLGGQVRGIDIGARGAAIQICDMSRGRELVCALAGPIGGLCLLPLAPWVPRLAVCAAVHSLYNLLPIYPLDGGRALSCIAALLLPPGKAQRLCKGVRYACILSCVLPCLWASFVMKMGYAPLLVAMLLLIRSGNVKIACKPGRQRLQ